MTSRPSSNPPEPETSPPELGEPSRRRRRRKSRRHHKEVTRSSISILRDAFVEIFAKLDAPKAPLSSDFTAFDHDPDMPAHRRRRKSRRHQRVRALPKKSDQSAFRILFGRPAKVLPPSAGPGPKPEAADEIEAESSDPSADSAHKRRKRTRALLEESERGIIQILLGTLAGIFLIAMALFVLFAIWSRPRSELAARSARAAAPPAAPVFNHVDQAPPPPTTLDDSPATVASPVAIPGSPSLSLSTPDTRAASLETQEQLAATEFSSQHYDAAADLYRELVQTSPRRPLQGYRLFTSLLLAGKKAEAQIILSKIPAPPSDDSPAWYYAKATALFEVGQNDEARAVLDPARTKYPTLCPAYDETLKTLGFH